MLEAFISIGSLLLAAGWMAGMLAKMTAAGREKKQRALDAAVHSDFTPFGGHPDPDTALISAMRMSAHALRNNDTSSIRIHTLDAQQALVEAGWDTKLVVLGAPAVFVIVALKDARAEMLVYRSE